MSSSENKTSGYDSLTESEKKTLCLALQCPKIPLEPDFDKLSMLQGVKKKTVSNTWGNIKKKMFPDAAVKASVTNDIGPPKMVGAKRKALAQDDAETKAKKSKGTPKGKKEEDSGEEDVKVENPAPSPQLLGHLDEI